MSSLQEHDSQFSENIIPKQPDNVKGNTQYISSNQPTWIYDNLSWYLSWMWGKTRSHAQPYVSKKYTGDCVYSDKLHGDGNSNFEIHLGGISSLFNKEKLKDIGITHILTAILGVGKQYTKDEFATLNLKVRDVEWEKLSKEFDKAVEFIKECHNSGGKVYVHCMCGVSRSSTLVAAYLIKEKGMTAEDAINHLHDCRNKVNPNEGFRQQLQYYESECNKQ